MRVIIMCGNDMVNMAKFCSFLITYTFYTGVWLSLLLTIWVRCCDATCSILNRCSANFNLKQTKCNITRHHKSRLPYVDTKNPTNSNSIMREIWNTSIVYILLLQESCNKEDLKRLKRDGNYIFHLFQNYDLFKKWLTEFDA